MDLLEATSFFFYDFRTVVATTKSSDRALETDTATKKHKAKTQYELTEAYAYTQK